MEILLNSCHTFDYYAFISRYLLENFIFLQSRAVVAYGCLFSDLRYNCNTCTQVAHTEILLTLRKKTANGVFTSLDEVNSSEYRFDLEIDIETAIVRSELEREQLEVLQKEINGLTKQQREVLYLKYYKKLNSDEIAEVMGLTSRTVYNTTHMAISRLRERLSKSFLLTVAANLWIFN